MNNIHKMNVQSCQNMMFKVYDMLIEKELGFSQMKPFLLWGQPGVGKSSMVYQLKNHIEDKYHKQVIVLDLRLYLYTEVDLKGVPYADQKREHTHWLSPKMFDLKDDPNIIYIIFLDELLAARQNVQTVALQLALDRKIDTIELPENTIIIAASNRQEDGCYIHPMSLALADRFTHVELEAKDNDWIAYAFSHHIDPRIISYLKFHPMALKEKLEMDRYAYCTPRTWEKLSNVISHFPSLNEIKDLVVCMIGETQGLAFLHYCKECENIPTMKDVMTGKAKVPTHHGGLYMICTQIIYTLLNKDLNPAYLNNIFSYISRLPNDYIYHILVSTKEYASDNMAIFSLPNYQRLMNTIGRTIR